MSLCSIVYSLALAPFTRYQVLVVRDDMQSLADRFMHASEKSVLLTVNCLNPKNQKQLI